MKANLLLNCLGLNPYLTLTRFRHSLGSNLSRFSLASLICLCMLTVGSGNVWGAQVGPTTITISSGWTNKSGATYCGGYGKNAGWYVSDYNITALSTVLSNAGNSNFSLTIRVKGLVNQSGSGGYVNSLSVVLLNSSGSTVGDPQTITDLPNGSNSSAAKWKSFSFTPTSAVTGYKIYGGKNCAVFQTEYTLTYDNAPSCDKMVTLNYDGDASGLHGSFVLKAGSASGSTIAEGGTTANCGSGTTSVVVVPTPDTHYHVASVSATNKTGDISGPDGDGNYTITYTQGSNISSTVTVTFEEDTKHTLTFYNNETQVEQIQVYEGEKIGNDLPTLTSGDACDATSNVFAGWTTENVGSTPVHSIDADQIVDYWTEPTTDMTINALWATTSGSPKAQFIAADETAKTASALDPISLTKNGINLYYESGNIYHSGSAHNFGINADNYCIISAEGLVIEKAVTTCSGSSYKIADVSDGTLSGDKLSVTDVRTRSLYLFANTNNPLRIVTLNVYTYDNYITSCCTPLGSLNGSVFGTTLFEPVRPCVEP